ncbi:WD repeat-containing protein 18-like [Watersipora subatra]|uniref:WD repeat-containing protein 18-like n=1 Tax=Watersipora subatra TaxID=2589382 RepID=UPI00355C425E
MAQLMRATEVIWSTESSGQLWNTCMWDLNTGIVEQTFKGGVSAPKSLCLVKDDYLVSLEFGKPLLHHWRISSKDSKQARIVLPDKASALAITRDGHYCVAAIAENVYVWQINSGKLLAKASAHYQPVKCLCLSDDGSMLLTAGEDAVLHCWSLARLVDQTDSTAVEPVWSSTNHSLAITDLCVGCIGARSRVVSLSVDQSCRLTDMYTGKEVARFLFDVVLTRVCMSACQSCLYVSTVTGVIHKLSLHRQVQTHEHHVLLNDNNDLSQSFIGHLKEVTCLVLSMDGVTLASGSKDMTVRLWHTPSSQCIRTLPHKGAITNLLITPYPAHITAEDYKPSTCFLPFDRHLSSSSNDLHGLGDFFIRPLDCRSQEEDIKFCASQAATLGQLTIAEKKTFLTTGQPPEAPAQSVLAEELRRKLEDSNARLGKAAACNRGLYEYSMRLLISADKTPLTSKSAKKNKKSS